LYHHQIQPTPLNSQVKTKKHETNYKSTRNFKHGSDKRERKVISSEFATVKGAWHALSKKVQKKRKKVQEVKHDKSPCYKLRL
jgi:hypothetical protein